jgi:AMP-binding enzyme C-terminal domain/Phosphopantetheine attachment site
MRVELEEVEAAIEPLPAVRDVCCTVAEKGPGGPAIMAYIVTDETRQHVVEDIRRQLARVLPRQMLPSRITEVDVLPRLPSGKVDRRALAHLRSSRPPEAHQHSAPRDVIEGQLREIWADCLARPDVGVIDNFFELGGHSLLAAHVVARCGGAWDRFSRWPTSLRRRRSKGWPG